MGHWCKYCREMCYCTCDVIDCTHTECPERMSAYYDPPPPFPKLKSGILSWRLLAFSASFGKGIAQNLYTKRYFIVDCLKEPELLDGKNINTIFYDAIVYSNYRLCSIAFSRVEDVDNFLRAEVFKKYCQRPWVVP